MQINNQNWKLIPLSASDDRLRRSDGVCVLGVCDNLRKEIYLNRNLTGELKRRVLTHEICHCFCFEYGLNLGMETEELICDFVATYGADVIGVVDEILRNARRYA